MNRAILNLSLLFGIIVFPFSESYSQQWQQVNGYSGPSVYAFAAIPQGSGGTNIFAGTADSGVYLSTDNGKSWAPVNSGLGSTEVSALAVSGTNIYAGTWGGIFLSTNNGTDWTSVYSVPASDDVGAIAVSGANIFAGTNGGIFLSTDNGASWKNGEY